MAQYANGFDPGRHMELLEDDGTAFHPLAFDPDVLEIAGSSCDAIIADGVALAVPNQLAPEPYQPDKIRQLCGLDAHLALVPLPHILANSGQVIAALDGAPVLVEQELGADGVPRPGESDQELADKGFGVHALPHPLLKTAAAYVLFQADLEPTNTSVQTSLHAVTTVTQQPEHGSVLQLRTGGSFTPRERDELWHIFSTRFEGIGPNMPLALAETRESTEELFADENYLFVVTKDRARKIACCAFGTDVSGSYPWISQRYLSGLNGPNQVHDAFVPGVARDHNAAAGMGQESINAIMEAVIATGHTRIGLRFECTDVSERTIPLGTRRAANRAHSLGMLATVPVVRPIARKRYVALWPRGR